MTEQDDLFNKDKEQAGKTEGVDSGAAVSAGEPSDQTGKAIKVDIGGGGIAGGEVRAVEPPPRSASSNLPLLLLVLVVLLLAGGYLFIQSSSAPVPDVVATAPQKQAIPIRLKADPQVTEQQVDQQKIVTADEPVVVKTATEPEKTKPAEAVEKPQPVADEKAAPVVAAPAPQVAAVPVAEIPAAANDEQETAPAEPVILYSVKVGPFLSKSSLELAQNQLREMGFEPQQTTGRGLVKMTRLLEGTYPPDEARQRLAAFKKKVKSAFILPAGEQRAIYAGSFQDVDRAEKLREKLAAKGMELSMVASEIEMDGKMLLAVQADQKTAEQVAVHLNKAGLQTHVVRQ